MTAAFKYIDEDLQNLKQLINFRIEDVIPHHDFHIHQSLLNNAEGPEHSNEQQSTESTNTDSPRGSKPPFHYSDLIEFALRDKTQMTVSEIYDWILFRFPYFKNMDESRWKPAVRHTLTTNSSFYKAKKANRGFLWAFRAPGEKKPEQTQETPSDGSKYDTHKSYNWKKRLCGIQSNTVADNSKIQTSAPKLNSTASPTTTRTSSSVEIQTDNLDNVLPIMPTLAHCNKTVIIASDDSDDDDDETCGECTCKVEYFIPRLPSELNLSSNSATCIPCCKGVHHKSDNNGCCLAVDGCQRDRDDEWTEIWSKVHGRQSAKHDQEHSYPLQTSSATQLLLPSKCKQGASQPLTNRYLLLTHAPSVKESKSGHMICLPISVPMYKKSAVLKKSDDKATLHDVPQLVAVAESGLLEGNSNVMAIPSTHSVCCSLSSSNMLNELFDSFS